MFFTLEDYKKIYEWISRNSIRDTEFNEALTPLDETDTITLVLNGANVRISLKDLVDLLFLMGVSDFLNITDKYREKNITLDLAIELIPYTARKVGQVITFLDTNNKWKIYLFRGELTQWDLLNLWEDILDIEAHTINSILPDEEDLTKTLPDGKGNSYLSLKDREYNPDDFSGLGRIILRKNIVEIEDPIYGKVKKNILYQDMLTQSNTIYEIRYDFDLNGLTITIPKGCALDFCGGKLSNGTINFNECLLNGIVDISTNINGKVLNSIIYLSWFYKNRKLDTSIYYSNIAKEVIDILQKGTVIFDGFKYEVPTISLKSDIIIDLNNSEIKLLDGTINSPIILIHNCHNVVVKNGIINGNKDSVSGNNTHGIRMLYSYNCTINNILFIDIRRGCLVGYESYNYLIYNIDAKNCGTEKEYATLMEAYKSYNFTLNNVSFLDSRGVGTLIRHCKDFQIINAVYRNISYDNGITLETCNNCLLDNIYAENVDNAGIEINSTEYITLRNSTSKNNKHHQIMITLYKDGGEENYSPCTNVTIENVSTSNSLDNYNGLKITSSLKITIIGSTFNDNVLISALDTIPNENITFINCYSPSVYLYSVDAVLINCDFTCKTINKSTVQKFPYSLKENGKSFSISDRIRLENGNSINIQLPSISNVSSCFGILQCSSYFISAPTLCNTTIYNFSNILNNYYSEEVSSISGTVSRKMTVTCSGSIITITNNTGVSVNCSYIVLGMTI